MGSCPDTDIDPEALIVTQILLFRKKGTEKSIENMDADVGV